MVKASGVIKDIVEGNECYAVPLGLALLLALETWELNETTLAVATCQRLWQHDIARSGTAEPTKNVDLLGYGFLSQLGEKAEAKEFLDTRKSCTREIKQLSVLFALSNDGALRERFEAALGRFPDELAYEFEEQKSDDSFTAHLKEEAERWADWAIKKTTRRSCTTKPT